MPGERQSSGSGRGPRPVGCARRLVARTGPTFLLTAVILSVVTPAGGTLLEPLSLHELTTRADVVIRGRVQSVKAIPHGPGRMPVTMAQIAILELLAGDLPPRRHLTVTQPGGISGEVALDYAGRPRFTTGREVVLFLARRAPGQYITVGLAQGKYDVADEGGRGRRGLSRDLNGAAFVLPASETPPADLAELRRRVQAVPRDLTGAQP